MAKLCPQCEKENPNAANVCMYCGTRLVEDAEMEKVDKLHSDLSDAKETIKVLKDALKEKEEKKALEDALMQKETAPVQEAIVIENDKPDWLKQNFPKEETFYAWQPEKKSGGGVWKGVGIGLLVAFLIVFALIYIVIASL